MASDPWTELLEKPITRGTGTWMHRGPTVSKPRGTREGDRQRLLSEAYREFYVRTNGAIPFKSVDDLETWLRQAHHAATPSTSKETYHQRLAMDTFASLVPQLLKKGDAAASSARPSRAFVDRPPQSSYQIFSGLNYPPVFGSAAQPCKQDQFYRGAREEHRQHAVQAMESPPGKKRKRDGDATNNTAQSKRRSGDKAFSNRVDHLTSSMKKTSEQLLSAENDNKQWATLRRERDVSLQRSLAQREEIRKEVEERQRETLAREVQKSEIIKEAKAKMMDEVRQQLQDELREPFREDMRRVVLEAEQAVRQELRAELRSQIRAELLQEMRQEMSEFVRNEARPEINRRVELGAGAWAQGRIPNGPVRDSSEQIKETPVQAEASDSAFGSKRTSADSSPGGAKRKLSDTDHGHDAGQATGTGEEAVKRQRKSPELGSMPAVLGTRMSPGSTDGGRNQAEHTEEISALELGSADLHRLVSRGAGDSHSIQQGEPYSTAPTDIGMTEEGEEPKPSEATAELDLQPNATAHSHPDDSVRGDEWVVAAPDAEGDLDNSQVVVSASQTVVAESQVTLQDMPGDLELAQALNVQYPTLRLTAELSSALGSTQYLNEEDLGAQRPPEVDHGEWEDEENSDLFDEDDEEDQEGESQMGEYDAENDGHAGFDDGGGEYEGAQQFGGYAQYGGHAKGTGAQARPLGNNNDNNSGGVIDPSTSNEVIYVSDSDDDNAKEAAEDTHASGAAQAAQEVSHKLEQSADEEELESEEESYTGSSEDYDEDDDQPGEAGTPAGEPLSNPFNRFEQGPLDPAVTETRYDLDYATVNFKQGSSQVVSYINPNISFDAAQSTFLNKDSDADDGLPAQEVADDEQDAQVDGDAFLPTQAVLDPRLTSSPKGPSQEAVTGKAHDEIPTLDELHGSDALQDDHTAQTQHVVSHGISEPASAQQGEQAESDQGSDEESDGELDDVQTGESDEDGSADEEDEPSEHEGSDVSHPEQASSPTQDEIAEIQQREVPDSNDVNAAHEGETTADGAQEVTSAGFDESDPSTQKQANQEIPCSAAVVSQQSQSETKHTTQDPQEADENAFVLANEDASVVPNADNEPLQHEESMSAAMPQSEKGPSSEAHIVTDEISSISPTNREEEETSAEPAQGSKAREASPNLQHEDDDEKDEEASPNLQNDDDDDEKDKEEVLEKEETSRMSEGREAVDVTKLGSSFRKPAQGPSNEELSRSLGQGNVSIVGGSGGDGGDAEGEGDGGGIDGHDGKSEGGEGDAKGGGSQEA